MEDSNRVMDNGADAGRSVGVLTKSVVRSPVIHWLLHARLRHKSLNDVVFVGDKFIHIRQIGREGPLEHIATKDDFDADIRAAKVFSNDPDPTEEPLLVKTEDNAPAKSGVAPPPDFLVLTLSTNWMVFLYIDTWEDGFPTFVQQAWPMPTFDRMLFQPGVHLAIDPQSRALAVAANEREVIIYSAKSRERIGHEVETRDGNWCPVSAQRQLQIDGVIQHMEYLVPPEDDQDHIILLLMVVDQRRTRAIHIDWYYTTDLHHARLHPAQSISSARTVPSLLIPLRNAAFMVFTGSEVRIYRDILTGPVTSVALDPLEAEPAHSGTSSLQPVWASWCRPRRSRTAMRDKDHIYLVREDGLVFLIVVMSDIDGIQPSSAGHFKCHVGRAFASLGDTGDPDILAVAGDTSAGRVVSIGHWPSKNGRVSNLNWNDTMEMELIETIPNWASATDMIASKLPHALGGLARSGDGVFMTSGKQPYGSITEQRHGLEARLSTYFDLDDLNIVSSVWALPVVLTDSVLFLMGTPATTRCLLITGDFESIEELGAAQGSAFEMNHRTIAAAVSTDGHIVQITERGMIITAGLVANFEDTMKRQCDEGERIAAASIDVRHSLILTTESNSERHILRCVSFTTHDGDGGNIRSICIVQLPSAPLAIATAPLGDRTLAVVATAGHGLLFFSTDAGNMLREVSRASLPSVEGVAGLCDHVVILRSESTADVLVLCGLRDGRLFTIRFAVCDRMCTDSQTRNVSQSTVRLVALSDQPSQACAMSGPDTWLLSWDGRDASSLRIDNIWMADKLRPELAQGTINAVCQLPATEFLASSNTANELVMLSGDEFLVASIEKRAAPVPRQIPLKGTPNRLLYSEQQRCFVIASLRAEIRSFPTPHSRPENRRQIWPSIDFIPSRDSAPSCTFDMQPGERVYALLEWSFRREDKPYSFILVGGSYVKRNGSTGGRITFLQPSQTNKKVVAANEAYSIKLEAAVYSLALYDDITFVACYGQQVCLHSFSPDERKWKARSMPKRLASFGVSVTVNAPYIYISTAEDSLVTLRLDPVNVDEEDDLPRLLDVSAGPQADNALSHVVVRADTGGYDDQHLALMSTKDGRIVGLMVPSPNYNAETTRRSSEISFEAQLSHSLTRIRQADVHPKWRPAPPHGVIVDNIIGVATDGTLVGVALLDHRLWRRLAWLQRLCEWDEKVSPHSFQEPLYFTTDDGYAREERALPIGINAGGSGEVMLRTSIGRHNDRHIDGDILARLLEKDNAEKLRHMLQQAAERDDQVGAWMQDHLEEELEAVDDILDILRKLLDCWI